MPLPGKTMPILHIAAPGPLARCGGGAPFFASPRRSMNIFAVRGAILTLPRRYGNILSVICSTKAQSGFRQKPL